ncbi:Sip1-related alpha-galactosidase [Marinoscillum furvescens]|uniref:Raffinose synthase Sip1-like protein n=1 Tax=Marinoscillum furvescens DSM 4134 TaxID=1122208 RepID=A0A3D9L733_MARFU|nr:Sip1-related alpha-galactosidase [Marinoscillum furvescens]REE00143.1 raffinose synthase Sip1-like protein [Marinoscillum furvescens DSM 4134]
MRKYVHFITLLTAFLLACEVKKEQALQANEVGNFDQIPSLLAVNEVSREGIFSINKQEFTPDSVGVIATIPIKLPAYEKGMYYRPFSDRVASGNRMEALWFSSPAELQNYELKRPREDDNMQFGAFMLLRKTNGQFLAVMPLVSKEVGNTFSVKDSAFYLQTATYGTDTVDIEIPLLAYAEDESPYAATRRVWELAKSHPVLAGQINWRSDKTFPEPFQYLGWCSWEHFRQKINEDIIANSIKDIQQSDLPIRWVMVDDGYLHQHKGQLLSFGVDEKKFPNGWGPITQLKDDKVKWLGIWRNFNGYMGGISPDHTMTELAPQLEESMWQSRKRSLLTTKVSQAASDQFYEKMINDTYDNGFDIIKVDFQSDNWRYNSGKSNAIRAVYQNQKALEEQVKAKGLHMINCIAMQNFNVFHQTYSSVIRSSVDYKNDLDRVDLTLAQNFTNALWLGHVHWTDQDMFHTSFKETARLMAVARAVSGGPVYLSDETKNIDDTYLKPLMYEDGRLLGTLAPAVPLPETLMQDPYTGGEAFRVIAPLKNQSAVILAFNLNRDTEVQASFMVEDYTHASGMLQPYEGKWEIPAEGLLLYDYFEQKAQMLNGEYTFSLGTRQEKLVQLSPIQKGWSIIGRADKYLGASSYTLQSISADRVVIDVEEAGPVLIWAKDKVPVSEQLTFEAVGNGLWKGTPLDTVDALRYTITQ